MVKRTKEAGIKVGVKLPVEFVEIIDDHVSKGKALSRADFVRNCVEWYLVNLGLIDRPKT